MITRTVKRPLLLVLPVVGLLAASMTLAASDQFVGTWKLNPAKSKLTDRLKVEAAGDNKYAFTFGSGREPETIVADGTDQPGQFGTTLAVSVEGPGTWRVVRKLNGRTLIDAKWKLSADGKTFTDSMSSQRSDGSTFSMDMTYKKTTPGSGFAGAWESVSEKVNSAYVLQIQAYEGDGLSLVYPGQQRNMKFDGKEYPDSGQNAIPGSTSSARRLNDRTLEITSKYKGQVMGTQEATLSPDGKVLTFTTRPQGQTKPNVLVFEREESKGTK